MKGFGIMKKIICKSGLFAGLMALLIFIDQWTKYLTRTKLADGNKVLIPNALELTYVKNTGAAWGILSNGTVFLAILSIVLCLFFLYLYIRIPCEKKYVPLMILAVCVMAGAIGNMYDRIVFQFVTDFIYISLINFPVFNFADMCVTFSCFITMVLVFTKYKDEDFSFFTPWKKKKESVAEDAE